MPANYPARQLTDLRLGHCSVRPSVCLSVTDPSVLPPDRLLTTNLRRTVTPTSALTDRLLAWLSVRQSILPSLYTIFSAARALLVRPSCLLQLIYQRLCVISVVCLSIRLPASIFAVGIAGPRRYQELRLAIREWLEGKKRGLTYSANPVNWNFKDCYHCY